MTVVQDGISTLCPRQLYLLFQLTNGNITDKRCMIPQETHNVMTIVSVEKRTCWPYRWSTRWAKNIPKSDIQF